MNPLEAALRPVANILNRNIQETTPARELCARLDETVVAIRVRDTALAAWFIIHDGVLELTTDHEGDPDVLISGSLLTLARMAGDSGTGALRDGSLEMAGDVLLAEKFQALLDSFLAFAVQDSIVELVGRFEETLVLRIDNIDPE